MAATLGPGAEPRPERRPRRAVLRPERAAPLSSRRVLVVRAMRSSSVSFRCFRSHCARTVRRGHRAGPTADQNSRGSLDAGASRDPLAVSLAKPLFPGPLVILCGHLSGGLETDHTRWQVRDEREHRSTSDWTRRMSAGRRNACASGGHRLRVAAPLASAARCSSGSKPGHGDCDTLGPAGDSGRKERLVSVGSEVYEDIDEISAVPAWSST